MSELSKFEITIILPTLNEGENLKFLLVDFIDQFMNERIESYEILIMDDGSDDGTETISREFNKQNQRIKLIKRKEAPSLPMAIYEGILKSKYKNVMWLDADGSMSAYSAVELIKKYSLSGAQVVIGSRFVQGGGYKGVKDLSQNSIFSSIRNVNNSKDSVSGMLASIIFNKILNFILRIDIKDLTSGFIIGDKELFKETYFKDKNYGEYFIYLIFNLYLKKIKIVEVGYICQTRQYGESKTASSIFQLFRRGLPYLVAANECRKLKNANS
tara:strand:+ start:158 stop:970 length:813 start_codon:yes stop_codon:yes gene_type:complete